MIKKVIFLIGPTASGKTELALELARRFNLEVISLDSMQVYRGMDIGTAKPTSAERRKVRHHLIDCISPAASFSVHQYQKMALRVIQDILRRGRTPLIVGGSGLYLQALWKGLSPQPAGNKQLRQKLEREIKRKGLAVLYGRLKKMDPKRAKAIHPHDSRRILRALEIAELSGKPPSDWQGKRESLEDHGIEVQAFGIQRDRSDLYERINQRVKRMFRKGFLGEVERLKRRRLSKTARQALGYREVLGQWKTSPRPLSRDEEKKLMQSIQQHTRQFAKRQLTWFRHEKNIRWIPWNEGETPISVCDKIAGEMNG